MKPGAGRGRGGGKAAGGVWGGGEQVCCSIPHPTSPPWGRGWKQGWGQLWGDPRLPPSTQHREKGSAGRSRPDSTGELKSLALFHHPPPPPPLPWHSGKKAPMIFWETVAFPPKKRYETLSILRR